MHDYKERGSNIRREWTLKGSFLYNTSGNTVGVIRDGHTGIISGVTRTAQGVYKVQLDTSCKYPVPKRFVSKAVNTDSANPPVKVVQAKYVAGSWDPVAKSFSIICVKVGTVGGAAAAPAVDDPDDGTRIFFEFSGSLSGAGTDAA